MKNKIRLKGIIEVVSLKTFFYVLPIICFAQPKVQHLNQLKWWFDVNEVNSLPKQQFLDKINGNGATIKQETLNKLLSDLQVQDRTQANLMQRISNQFDNIFEVK